MEIGGSSLRLHANVENLLTFVTLIKKRQMKLFASLLFILFAISACGPSAQDREVRESARQSLLDQNASLANTAPANQLPATAAVNTSVSHYICPNNCEGSGGDAEGTCPVCGSAYLHNQAYHSTPAATTPTSTPDPPQNAAGYGIIPALMVVRVVPVQRLPVLIAEKCWCITPCTTIKPIQE